MTADHVTHTETEAGLFEFRHGDTVYGDDRPTRAEAARDEQAIQTAMADEWPKYERDECLHIRQRDDEGRTVWPPNYDATFICYDCGDVVVP